MFSDPGFGLRLGRAKEKGKRDVYNSYVMSKKKKLAALSFIVDHSYVQKIYIPR